MTPEAAMWFQLIIAIAISLGVVAVAFVLTRRVGR